MKCCCGKNHRDDFVRLQFVNKAYFSEVSNDLYISYLVKLNLFISILLMSKTSLSNCLKNDNARKCFLNLLAESTTALFSFNRNLSGRCIANFFCKFS